jgi:hypothetical protein
MRAEKTRTELLAELGRTQRELAAAERRARSYLAERGVLDQTTRDVRALLRESVETGNSEAPESV